MDLPAGADHHLNLDNAPLAGETAEFLGLLADLYGKQSGIHLDRYRGIEDRYGTLFGDQPDIFVSTPGRVEIGGNHTDHNNGLVIAASITLDTVGAVGKSDDTTITLVSSGYPSPFQIRLDDLRPVHEEEGTTAALIRGIAARFLEEGHTIGALRIVADSRIPVGSGLSSSASIEMLIAAALNALYNDGRIPSDELAAIGRYAENVYFGKPSGLMDQLTCATGGMLAIDFRDPRHPEVHRIRHRLDKEGMRIAVVHTGGSHADLTGDYAAIPTEMRAVAAALGKNVCSDLTGEAEVVNALPGLRASVGDRAVLRAIHFLREMQRVPDQVRALEEGRTDDFLAAVNASGRSSALWLQNSYPVSMPEEQGISLALALTEGFLARGVRGACRVHGGGFAGTILALLPAQVMGEYTAVMERVFGGGSVSVLDLRTAGTLVFGGGR